MVAQAPNPAADLVAQALTPAADVVARAPTPAAPARVKVDETGRPRLQLKPRSKDAGMSWFSRIFGFTEKVGSEAAWTSTREQFEWDPDGTTLTSKANAQCFEAGRFSTPSLEELRARVDLNEVGSALKGPLVVKKIEGDISELHVDPTNAFALFQAASQFNCLEFKADSMKPEDGVEVYQTDKTQGPACATACGSGTVVRNYFGLDGEGQTARCQIENLRDVEDLLQNRQEDYFRVIGGYTKASDAGLERLTAKLHAEPELAEGVRAKLRIGLQQDTEVTGSHMGMKPYQGERLLVTQAYCSACSVTYSRNSKKLWECFASLVLDSAYEAILYAAVENALRNPGAPAAKKVFLTSLGGGMFGNEPAWIKQAMKIAFEKFRAVGLEVYIVGGPAVLEDLLTRTRMIDAGPSSIEPAPATTPSLMPTAATAPSSEPASEGCMRLADLQNSDIWQARGIDAAAREQLLCDDEFAAVFGMDKAAFAKLPKWKRDQKKKEHCLF